MNGFRSFTKGLAVFLLFVVLLVTPVVVGLQAAVNSPEAVKASLDKGRIYDAFTGSDLLSSNSHLSSATRSDPEVEAAFNDAISPMYVKVSSEKLIDNAYSYIRGSTDNLDLSVDVNDAKNHFANNIASYVKQKFEALPRCTELKIPSTSIESLLEATCAPIGVSSQQASEYARSEIANTTLFSNDRLEVAGLIGTSEVSLNANMSNLRTAYPYFIALVYALPIASVVLATGILFLSNTRRRGVKTIANILMSVGIMNALGALIFIGLTGLILGNSSEAGSLVDVVSNLLGDLRIWWLGLTGIYITLSTVIYIVLAVTKKPKPTLSYT